jgi:maltose O-acetyltransferase
MAPLRADFQRRLARIRGVTIGPGCEIHSSVRIDGPVQLGEHCRLRQDVYIRGPRVQLGNWVFLNDGVYVNHDVYLADHVSVGQFTRFITGTHAIGPHEHRAGATRTEPIHVGLGTWIGASVTVLPGVTIGAGVIVASGALVLDDVEDDCLVAGVPAVVKKTLAR